jgi:hypothetical protein
MEHPDEVVRLLAEIRDLEREVLAESRQAKEELLELHRLELAEFRRVNEEYLELHKRAEERATRQGNAFWWALIVLIAICLATNAFVLLKIGG